MYINVAFTGFQSFSFKNLKVLQVAHIRGWMHGREEEVEWSGGTRVMGVSGGLQPA